MRPSYLPKTYRPWHCHKVTSASDTNYIPKHLKLANPLPACHHFQSVSFPGCISFLFRGESLWWLELEGIQPSELRRPPHQNSEVKWFTCEWRRCFLPKDLNEAKTKTAAKGLHWYKIKLSLIDLDLLWKKNVWNKCSTKYSPKTVVKNGGWVYIGWHNL